MKKFLIQGSETNIWTIEVEAESEDKALEAHEKQWEEAQYSYEFHYLKDGNTEWDVIEEVKDDD